MTENNHSEKSEADTSSRSVSLKTILSQLVHLSEDELVKDKQLVDVLLPADQVSQAGQHVGPGVDEQANDELVAVQDWLKSIIDRKPIEQLALIEESLENVEGVEAIGLLNRERQALLDREPRLAMKVAVLKQVRERPIYVLIGVLGLIFGVGSFVVNLFQRIF